MSHPLLCPTCSAEFEPAGLYRRPVRNRERLLFFLLPRRVYISQGHHQGTHNKSLAHALDFAVPIRSRVLAARDGVVADLAGHFKKGGRDEALRYKANFVCIRHEDGRYSRYYHLYAVSVKLGQRVKCGELIGYSGNTGFTMGPHLHFDVVDVLGVEMASLRIIDHSNPDQSRQIRCVPLTFSRFPFPENEMILPLFCADPLDLGAPQEIPFEEEGFALICERGGVPSFLEKAQQASRCGARCLVIVDNDASMRDAMPLLIGDSTAAFEDLWVLFVAYSNRDWLYKFAQRSPTDRSQMLSPSISIGLGTSPNFKSVPFSPTTETPRVLTKPLTFPVSFDDD